MKPRAAKFGIGEIVKHRKYPFRGVIYDIDPVFANTEEWWLSIPEEVRPAKDQPFYHLYAENSETEYTAYVSEQNLELDNSGRASAQSADRRDLRARRYGPLCAEIRPPELKPPKKLRSFDNGCADKKTRGNSRAF